MEIGAGLSGSEPQRLFDRGGRLFETTERGEDHAAAFVGTRHFGTQRDCPLAARQTSPARPRSNRGCARLLSASAQVGPKGERAIEGRERVGRAATLSERIAAVGPGGGEIGRERERAIGRGQRFVTTFEVGERVAAIVMCGDEFRLKRERPVICGERLRPDGRPPEA